MIRRAAFTLLALALLSAPLSAQETREIEAGQSLSGTLAAGERHDFTLELDADRFVYGAVDQRSVDVVVTILDEDGEALASVDGPAAGEERFYFDSEDAGRHTIRVTAADDGEGDYVLHLRVVEPVATDPEERVDQLMTAYSDDGTPGVVVGVVEDGELVLQKGYGTADLTWDVPLAGDMRSNIGSVTKQFTAMGILLLEQEGELSLDDEVRKHIPELPDFGVPVTLRNLLNHVGGYREVYNAFGMMGYGGEDAFPREKVIQLVQRQPDLQAPPNTEFNYNNTGYILLAMTIERVSGMSFADYMRTHVFAPLGMTHTLVTSHQGQIIPNSTRGYVPVEEGGWRLARDLPAAAGAGGIYTTAEDMAKWMLNYRDATLGGPAAIAAMTTNTVLASGDSTGYGLGLGLGEMRGRTLWSHTGGDVAHRTFFGWFPELESGVWVSSGNALFPTGLGRGVAEAFFEDEMEPEEDEDAAVAEGSMSDARKEAVAGKWQVEGGPLVEVRLEDGDLRLVQGEATRSLTPTSDSTVEIAGLDASVTFHFEPDGSANRATLTQTIEIGMTRVETVELTVEELREYEGRYWSDEIEVAFELVVEEGQLVARSLRLLPVNLEATERDEFEAPGIGNFEFRRSGNGQITGFVVNNGRTRDVWFERAWAPGG
ncbi:MAG: serine hydrolase domain-containing protein [Gemmatimonadota bacterium]|jgi:CubicO group peptidase (beta-lactamase class C family)